MFHSFLGTLMLEYLTCQKSVSELCNKIRDMRVTLISGQGWGANFEAKKGLQDFNGDSLISCTKVAAENVRGFVRGRKKTTHDKSWLCSVSQDS